MTAMRPILLRDACVVTMHPTLGELSRGAVLIDGDRIAAVAPDIEAGDAETIDARGSSSRRKGGTFWRRRVWWATTSMSCTATISPTTGCAASSISASASP
jgi:predicted amidohydrolase